MAEENERDTVPELPVTAAVKKPRGFAAMTPEQRSAIGRMGGRTTSRTGGRAAWLAVSEFPTGS